ncbi:MAG TPA: hemolysin family protein [Bacteroidia bacterium]|nr:hemolysin family protein [Bacteroidia bacterium]
MLGGILLTLLFVLLNALFVAAEFAFVKVRSTQLEVLANKGSYLANIAKKITEKLDAYLSATQVGITLASLGLGWIGEQVVSKIILENFSFLSISGITLHSISSIVAFLFITFMHITFGEQIPKMMSIHYAVNAALLLAVPLNVFYLLFKPFIWILNGFSNFVLNALKIKNLNDEAHSEEEIKAILTESEESGSIQPSEYELIQNVFEFDDRVVKQIMLPIDRVSAFDINWSKDEILKKILEDGFSRMPVYSGNISNIIGIIHTKDFLKFVIENKLNIQKADIQKLMRTPLLVPENAKINKVLKELQKRHTEIAIVIDEFGNTSGIITMEDIIEELVGDIQDEHDDEKPMIEKKNDKEFIINAMINISEINDALPYPIPENPLYDTVAGYLNYLFGHIPNTNESIETEHYTITVLKSSPKKAELVKFFVKE